MEDNTALECIRTVAAMHGCKILQLYEYDAKGLVIVNTQDRGRRKYNFFSKKLITHPNFPSNFHTPSENLPKLSYPNMYKLLCVDNFYDI